MKEKIYEARWEQIKDYQVSPFFSALSQYDWENFWLEACTGVSYRPLSR